MSKPTEVTRAKDYKEARLSAKFASLVQDTFEKSVQQKALEEECKENRKTLAEILADKGEKSVSCNGLRVTYVPGSNVTISKEKLLELGVPVAIIEKATVRKSYETVQITREKEDK